MGAILAQMIDCLSLCPSICQLSFLLPKQYDSSPHWHTFQYLLADLCFIWYHGIHLGSHLGRRIACNETLTVFVSTKMLFVGLSIKTIFVSIPSLHLFTIYRQIYNNFALWQPFGKCENFALNYAHAFLLFNSTAKQFSLAHCQMNLCHLGANIWQL